MKSIAVLYIVMIGVIIFLANTGRLGPVAQWIGKVPYGDAVMHAVLMGLLVVAVNAMFAGRALHIGQASLLWATILVVIFVVVEETTQLFLANRTFSFIDLGADFIGIGVAGIIIRKNSKKG